MLAQWRAIGRQLKDGSRFVSRIPLRCAPRVRFPISISQTWKTLQLSSLVEKPDECRRRRRLPFARFIYFFIWHEIDSVFSHRVPESRVGEGGYSTSIWGVWFVNTQPEKWKSIHRCDAMRCRSSFDSLMSLCDYRVLLPYHFFKNPRTV